MTEDTSPAYVILFALLITGTFSAILIGLGDSVYKNGYNSGKTEGTNLTTIECVKEPKKCKVRYDYLMMMENQK